MSVGPKGDTIGFGTLYCHECDVSDGPHVAMRGWVWPSRCNSCGGHNVELLFWKWNKPGVLAVWEERRSEHG